MAAAPAPATTGEGSAKSMVTDQISQAVQSTSNLLQLMLQSSPSRRIKECPSGGKGARCSTYTSGRYLSNTHVGDAYRLLTLAQLIKLPKNLLAKTSTIKNTEQILEQLPRVISSLDAHMDNGLQSVPHLGTVTQLLENMESCQLKPLYRASLSSQEPELTDHPSQAG